MSALSLQRREAINSRSKHSLESNHEKGTKTSYTDGFVPLYTAKKSYYAFSQTDFYHKTNPNLFFRKGSDQKFLWNDSKNDTIPGYRFAIALSFYIGCIWVQNRCGWVQIVARWVQHRAFVLSSIIQYSQFAIMSIPLWRVAASIAPTACAITCPSALMKKEVGKE